ncbi:MAG: choice-of-anchor Q domain-containing protein [Bacteroidota bacterium]
MKSLGTDSGLVEERGEFFEIRQFLRWDEYTRPRVVDSKGDLALMYEKQKKGQLQVNAIKQKMALQGNDNWSLIGPKAQSNSMWGNGRVNRVRVDPTNASILYACTPGSQLFKSTNGGTSWTSISNGFPTAGVGDLAIDPSNPSILYATTGDSDYFNAYSDGVYKSTDGGLTWIKLTSLPIVPANTEIFTSIVMNPAQPGSFLVSSTRGIYRFTDGGATVVKVAADGARDLSVMPGNPNIMFAGSYWSYYGPTKFVRSDDNGLTWIPITNGLPTGAFRYAISISPVNPNLVYVWTCIPPYTVSQGVYCSTDAGVTFKQMNGGTPNMCGNQGGYNLCISADPVNAATVYAGGVDLYRSTDTGKTWVNLTTSYTNAVPNSHPDVHGIMFSGPSTMYIANDGGVYKTTNAGQSFSNISSNLSIAQLWGFSMSSTNSNLILSGHQDNGSNLTTDLESWRMVTSGDGLLNLVDRTDDNIMFTTLQFGNIFRSLDRGATFSTSTTGFTKNVIFQTPLIQDANVASTFYAASDKIYRSTDYGANWTAISPAFDGIVAIDIDRKNSNIMYLATYFNMFKTIDGGVNWIQINNGLTLVAQMSSLHIDVNNSSILYATCGAYSGSLFRSVDAGASWALWITGLPNLPTSIVVTQLGAHGEVYCGTDNGVYHRNAASTSWTLYNTNLPPAPVKDLKIFYPTGRLRAATYGRGIWESPLAFFTCNDPLVYSRIYVDSNATGANTGANWANAFKRLQDGIKAVPTCGVKEIWVANGTYYPDQGAGVTLNSRTASFGLKNNVAIYGGFSGSETLLSQRNWLNNKTILSGEIGNANSFADNSYSVVETLVVDSSAVLDGFTITAGNADANTGIDPASRGGGLYVGDNGAPTINNCLFLKNYAIYGGAAFVRDNSHATFSNCAFTGNNCAGDGSCIYNRPGSKTKMINCTFTGNVAAAIGNGSDMGVVITNSIIWGNSGSITRNLATVTNSIVQGGYPGAANLDQDPLFVGQPAIVFGATGNLHLTPCSPAIDAGNDAATTSMTDLDGSTRKENLLPNIALVDMGAYERSGSTTTLYVNANAAGKGDGSGWANAYQSFYEALQVYNGCISVDSVLIAAGTYQTPGGVPFIVTKTNGVVLGGYPISGGTRNATTNPVIIKGEMQVKQSVRIDGIKVQ